MKKQSIFPGILLVGIGLYFLLDQLQVPMLQKFNSWPTLLIIIGIAFLAQSYSGKDSNNLVPGVILLGIGLHFHLRTIVSGWPDHWAVYTVIIGIAFLLRYQKTKSGLMPALILIFISIIALFYQEVSGWLGWIGSIISMVESYWAVGLIIVGLYLLFFKKK